MANDPQAVLELAVKAGQTLLQNGAEVFRVQQTMEIIAAAYDAEEFHVYVLTNGIFASVGQKGSQHVAKLEFVPSASVHLGRIDAVNSLSRRIAAGQVEMADAFEAMERIRRIPPVSLPRQVLACGLGTGMFALLFGGNIVDFAGAAVCGLVLQLFLWQADIHGLNKIIIKMLGAALVSVIGAGLLRLGLGHDLDKIIIGSIMPLTPGIALTMAIRDFFNADYLSGTIRLMDALLSGMSIACGVGAVLTLTQMTWGVAL